MSSFNFMTAAEAVALVKSNNRVFVHGGAATPTHLLNALAERADELRNVELVNISLQGKLPEKLINSPDSFYFNSLFVSQNIRSLLNKGSGADYVPVFLSEIPELFNLGYLPLDVALIHVSLPDKHGFCSLGTSVDVARAALKYVPIVIAQVNHRMPRSHGDGMIHHSRFAAMVEVNEELHEVTFGEGTPEEIEIGRRVAELIEDGATLQMGIGAIPNIALSNLKGHKQLGVHTEMFSDGLIPLIELGVVTNELKVKHPGKTVSGFVLGTRKVYDFINDNPSVAMLDTDYVNDDAVIRCNPKVAAINSAIEIDLTGQICADSMGTTQYSGVGGQMDFIRGAALSRGGKPIIAMPSTTSKGESKIVPMLKPGAGVVTTRAHVHYVVTEYGTVNLFGKSLRQRAKALIDLAHPNHREWLHQAAFERFGIYV